MQMSLHDIKLVVFCSASLPTHMSIHSEEQAF